ncbi:unnamed protein product [Caenorhabditis bovis]|uniref:Uncharacterized protein n=1 Tax=Caenorhabditis bovis TaxID=2654633 RepID=A0A8S1FD76_9PELO|nr:unnamed protein product [Caenorhabditis bovis]
MDDESSNEPSTSNAPPAKSFRTKTIPYSRKMIPVIRPKVAEKTKAGPIPTPLIALLDRTQSANQKKKTYFPDMKTILEEFGLTDNPIAFKSSLFTEKLEMIQKLRGENEFLRDEICKKNDNCRKTTLLITNLRNNTIESSNQCQFLHSTISGLETEIEEIKRSIGE